jgi:hypothetical protein
MNEKIIEICRFNIAFNKKNIKIFQKILGIVPAQIFKFTADFVVIQIQTDTLWYVKVITQFWFYITKL